MMRPLLLVILDGFGEREASPDNAITTAHMPNFNRLREEGLFSLLETSGSAVGLPDGQMGNSEVGHLNLGAGRVVDQISVQISKTVSMGQLSERPELRQAAATLQSHGGTLHLIGLVSGGGVHSRMEHLIGAAQAAVDLGVERVAFHALTDGRDTAPTSGVQWLEALEAGLPDGAYVASIGGRFYGMDRDQRWERVEKAWETIVAARGPQGSSACGVLKAAYAEGETDEFLTPHHLQGHGIQDGDAVWFLNFRADRVRQLAAALTRADEPGCFQRRLPQLSACFGMVEYRHDLSLGVLFPRATPKETMGELVSRRGLAQFRIAETEKYAHVTYFFNGGDETQFPGEKRLLVPSPREVETYDQKPSMSAPEVTDHLIEALNSGDYGFCLVNYANPDMVGHTGVMAAAVEAMEALDHCLERLITAARQAGYAVAITADHGNIEQMTRADGSPHTQHTTGPVPLILLDFAAQDLEDGALCDVAPTCLQEMGIEIPEAMTGRVLSR
ncbi:MAG: phosphoglycerate mutase (2,3-diphosphoglycerate-independent) [Myxococcales bacterium]|nr:phosphoglycerate mutase (2,3-diphosphoglycerate-independent) [Myxococcales bacterium]